jgi:serine/threonine protein kinase
VQSKLYICMEYAQGGNLYDHIQRQTAELPEERVWQLFIQVTQGDTEVQVAMLSATNQPCSLPVDKKYAPSPAQSHADHARFGVCHGATVCV